MSAEGFEKNRIQNPDEAHEEANMLSSYLEGGEQPTSGDYVEALNQLEMLKEAANEGSVESMDKALRVFTAGAGVAVERIPRLLVAAALNVLPYPKRIKEITREQIGGGIIEQLKGIGGDYERMRTLFQTAREELEKWKAEAEELAKKQTEQN